MSIYLQSGNSQRTAWKVHVLYFSNYLALTSVMVSYCYYNKFSQIHWLKRTHIYSLTVLESKVCNELCRAKINMLAELVPSELSKGKGLFPPPLLSAFRGYPHSLAYDHTSYCFLLPQLFLPHGFLPSLTFLTLSYKTFQLYLWLIRKIQNNHSLSESSM